MMGAHFQYLQKRITTLRRFMLPSKFQPTGLYPDRVHQRTAAFRLLAHAEFESFLEELVTTHVTNKTKEWSQGNRPSITIAAILAYDEVEGKPPTSLLNPPQKPADHFDERLRAAVGRFQQRVRVLNHGVREANVLGMLLPIGVNASALDVSWLATLDSWAQERGDIAHQSSGKVQHRLDPAREYTTVKTLLKGFRTIEDAVAQLP